MSSLGQRFIRRFVYVFAGAATAISMGIATDYGIGPASAAPASVTASTPLAAADGRAGGTVGHAIGSDPGKGFVRLPGHVLDSVRLASHRDRIADSTRLTLGIVLRRDDTAGFEQYMKKVYSPGSGSYRHFLTQEQITERFGPSAKTYAEVSAYMRSKGLTVIKDSKNRLTIMVRGSRKSVESAFRLRIQDYQFHDVDYFANDADPALPEALASRVLGVTGLSNLSSSKPVIKSWVYQNVCGATAGGGNGGSKQIKNCVDNTNFIYAQYHDSLCSIGTGDFSAPTLLIDSYAGTIVFEIVLACAMSDIIDSLNGIPPTIPGTTTPFPSAVHDHFLRQAVHRAATSGENASQPLDGTGQTIGLVEFDSFSPSDISDYLAYIGAPAAIGNNLTTTKINGGVSAPGAGETEVLLDIETALTLAPGAKVTVYEAPFNGGVTSYTGVFNAMINDGVTVISNSWASCEDQVSVAEAQGIDSVLQAAAASGISVFNGTGDSGSTCLDGSPNTISVPADSPNATAVGGSSWVQGLGPGRMYGVESWWDGSGSSPPTGQSGFGVSRYFSRPSYQSGLAVGSNRSIPDVVARADPADGVIVCQADLGGCPSGTLNGGTSLSAPEWAAIAAVLNQRQGRNLGALNPQLYALAQTAAFHNAASMSSDFQHVGLGSPNINVLSRLLRGETEAGIPSAVLSITAPLIQPATNIVQPGGTFTVPADGTSQGGVLVRLYDSEGNSVSGKTVTLSASGGHAVITPASGVSTVDNGAVPFFATDLTAETVKFTATDTTDGVTLAPIVVTFGVPAATSAGITADPPTVTADGSSAATITVTMKDSLDRPTPGKTISLSDGGAHAVLTGPVPAVTDANGQIQFTATDQVNETVMFSAVDVTDGNLPFPGTATVTYSNSSATACDVGLVPVAASGYSITPYITGLPASPSIYFGNVNWSCSGANFPAFAPSGEVLESDFVTGGVYETGLSGGNVSSANLISNLNLTIANFVFTADGNLYATQKATTGDFTTGDIIQVDPTTGASLRVVASSRICPSNLAVDPLSGDLFFDDECSGAGSNDASLFRLIDPAGTDPSRPTSVVTYMALPSSPNGAIAFAPNGTLYVLAFGSPSSTVEQVSATNAAKVTVSQVAGITTSSGIAIGSTNADGSAQSLIVDPAGVLSEVSIANPSQTTVLATVSPGVGVTGPDGCLYAAHYDTVYRLANRAGSCTFAQTSRAPFINLTPATVSPNPEQGNAQTFTATLNNVSPRAGVPIDFIIGGANSQRLLAHTNANGVAVASYSGAVAGSDLVTATATTGSNTQLQSNSVKLTWAAGRDLTFMTLNLSPQAAQANVPVTITVSLSDVTESPISAVSGQSITVKLGTSTCTAITNSTGTASCSVTPMQIGAAVLSASFAGTTQLTPAAVTAAFNVSVPLTPAPTVTLRVNPTTIAAGTAATLSWSSSNATACAASGSWSSSEATNGTETVTPASPGSYSYKLTCTGNGGSAAATAVLSATLVTVTVTAHSGGGVMTWPIVLLLGLLAMLRLRGIGGAPGHRAPGHGKAVHLGVGGGCVGAGVCLLLASRPLWADQSPAGGTAVGASSAWLEPFYVGVRFGTMVTRLNARNIDAGLDALGYPGVAASTGESEPAGTVYIGYELAPHADLEFGYTHRSANVATLDGTVRSVASVLPLLQDTSELIRGYGNVYALSFRPRVELAPKLMLDPRIGAFFWDTKTAVQALDVRFDNTHSGGGLTLGVGLAYHLWRGLELGAGADFFRGVPNNIGTLYAGTLEWRFGRQ